MKELHLNEAQLKAELEKCLQCPTKPCQKACPVGCSPCDFIALAKNGEWKKSAQLIEQINPLAQTCGLICPQKFCMKACLRAKLDSAIKIPAVQASIMKKGRVAEVPNVAHNGKKVAVVGLGPAGIGAVSKLLKQGYEVSAYEADDKVGGALNLIPQNRLPKEVLAKDWEHLRINPRLTVHYKQKINDYEALLAQGFAKVYVAVGEQNVRRLGVNGDELAITYVEYLQNPQEYASSGAVAIVGGGEVALDCALTAKNLGALRVEMFVRRRLSDMRMDLPDYAKLIENAIDVTTMTRVAKISRTDDNKLTAYTVKTRFNAEQKLEDEVGTLVARDGFDLVILALGSDCLEPVLNNPRVVKIGNGSSAVEAIGAGIKSVAK